MENELINQSNNKKRISFIDCAKFLSIFAVCLSHLTEKGYVVPLVDSFCLASFFFLSGYTLSIKENESFGDFLVKKLKSYVIPLFSMDILIMIIQILFLIFQKQTNAINIGFFQNQIVRILEQKRLYALWFIPALFNAILLSYFYIYIAKKETTIYPFGNVHIIMYCFSV